MRLRARKLRADRAGDSEPHDRLLGRRDAAAVLGHLHVWAVVRPEVLAAVLVHEHEAVLEDAVQRVDDLLRQERAAVRRALDLDLALELFFERDEVGRPGPALDRLRGGGELLQGHLRVAGKRDLGSDHALDLERVDVDLDDAGSRREVAAEPGLELLEPAADDEHGIGLVHRAGARAGPVEADEAEREPVALRDRAAAGRRRHHRRVEPLGELDERALGAGQPDASAGPDHRPLGLREELRGLFETDGIGCSTRGERRPIVRDLAGGGGHVRRDLDEDGAGLPVPGQGEGALHRPGGALGEADARRPLRHRPDHLQRGRVLEAAPALVDAARRGDKADERAAGVQRLEQAGDQVRHPRARTRVDDAHAARDPCVRHRHEDGRGLVPDEDRRDLGELVEVVVEELRVAGQAEDVLDVLGGERLANGTPGLFPRLRHRTTPRRTRRATSPPRSPRSTRCSRPWSARGEGRLDRRRRWGCPRPRGMSHRRRRRS